MAYDEKAVVKIDADGKLLNCAKGYDVAECGFTPGSKVCGKCGAMAVAMKMVPVDDEEVDEEEETASKEMGTEDDLTEEDGEMLDEEEDFSKKKPMKVKADAEMMEEDDEEAAEDEEESKGWGKKKPMMMKAEDEDGEEEEDQEGDGEDAETPKAPQAEGAEDEAEAEAENEEEEDEEEDEEDEDEMGEKSLLSYRSSRLSALNVKSEELAATGYLCSLDRKVYPGSTPTCDDCMGGCTKGEGIPFGLLEVEGLAEASFKGQVIDSGYSDVADMYVVDILGKNEKVMEVYIQGTTGEVKGMIVLDSEVLQEKSLDADIPSFIDFAEAADIALKSIPGELRGVEPDILDGFDCYAVEIDGVDGKSYDVYVSLDGVEIGRESYDMDEAADIEAEAAEIALKRAFSDDQREEMAKQGNALPDGSFPIANRSDLSNAIMAFGRAKDKDKAKAHIMKRARELNAEDMIPENWGSGEKSLEDGEFLQSLAEFELLADELDN